MRGMILRTVLFCIGTVLAFPTLDGHLPQTIDCPNSDIHVFINQSAVDRSEYTFVDWNAANLQDCIEKCFGNHFCYSIRFDSSLEHNCGLYYFAAYNCSNQALTKASTIDYKGGSITLDCIRCPGRGDFVTAPPFSSVGEQTIVSETAVLARGKNIKGTATEITHNSEHDGVPHAEVEGDTANVKGDEGKTGEREGEKGAVEGSGEAPTAGSPSETGGEKTGEEPSASTETTLTGQNPAGEQSEAEGSTAVPSAESSDATTGSPEETAEATVVPSSEAGEGTTAEPGTGAAPSADGAAETTVAPTESGVTETPGAEAGSTPAGAENTGDEPSTVEGSGEEEEEATTPLTGESNGEAESIGEASGEGSPSASESSSRAPGIKPTEGVEGSGFEGSGETPEIGLQEEEEPVKVEVETTTVWNGHTEQPRVCGGNLRFVPSSIVDLDTVQLLVNSTKANSPSECAKICYEHNCGFAYYEPSTFICQFMANTEELVDSSTCPSDHKDAKYQAEFRTDVASTLTCVVCAKDSEVDKEKPALQPIASPRRGSYPACIISFQAAAGDHSSFPFYKSVQVGGLNECARHCFIGECSQSVYNPKTKECRLGSNPKDTCNNLPIIQKFVAQSDEVLLQCFRCVPEDLIGVKGTVSETTGYREPPTAAESIDESAATANREKEQSAAAAAATTTPAADTTEAATEAPTEAPTTEAEPEETTTIAGTGDEVELTEPLPEGVTEAPEETTTVTESTTTVEETTPIGGEEVELEEASGEEETTTTSGEIATSSSGYDSTTVSSAGEKVGGKEGEEATTTGEVEGSGEEGAAAPEAGANKDYEASTAAGAASKDEEAEGATTAASEETTTGRAEGEATTAESEEGTTVGGEEEATTAAEGEEGTTAAAAEGEETTAATGEVEATTEATSEGSSTVTPEEGATTEAGAEGSTLSPEEAATSEGPGEMSKAIEQNDKPLILASEDLDFGKSCVIKFQSAPFSDRPSTLTAQFEKTFPVDSIELCATRCFQDGCTSAKYEPESKTCHLAYEDKPICDRTELHLRMKEVEGDTWIHCVNCYPEKSVVNDVLGAPLNHTSSEEEEKEGKESVLDKVVGAVSDAAHSVAETITGEKPDLVLKHGCIVNFQTSLSSEMAEKVEYLPPFKTRYAHRCATKCFQEGCAAATFNPTTNECSLGYGRFVKCSNGPLVTTALDVKETVTIHCMSCIHHKPGEGGIDLVVLSPDDARIHLSESQDVPAEEVEGSGTEDSTVSKVEGGESTTGAAETAEGTTAASEEGSTASVTEEGTTAGMEEGSTVAAEEGTSAAGVEEATTAAGVEEGSTAAGAEEGTTAVGTEEASTVSGAEGTEGQTTAESTTAAGEEATTVEGSGEVNGGTLGSEGPLEGPGTGKIKEVPLETAADGVQLPKGVNLEEADGKVQVNEEGKKFKPELPTGFSIDSGLGKVQVDGKMTDGLEAGGKGGAGTGEKGTAAGIAGEGEQPAEATTGAGIETETGESSTESPSETSSTSGEGAEASTGLTTGEEGGESTTASTDESASSTETPSESTTAVGETSTTGEEAASSTDGHGIIHPAKEFEHTPLHPEGEEVEVETAETTTSEGEVATSTSKDSEATTAAAEETTTEEEGPAFVQESPSEDEEKAEEGLSIANDDLKHREGLVEKALATGKPESTTGATVLAEKPVAAESIDEAKGTVSPAGEEEATKSSVAPVEASTSAPSESSTSESTESSTTAFSQPSGGELDAMAAMDETETEATKEEATTSSSEGSSTVAASTDATTPAASESTTGAVSEEGSTTTASTDDLQHREGILEKALASANPAATTKEGEKIESTTTSSENADASSSTVEPVIESTVASSTESSPSEGAESTVASSTEGSIDAGETTVSSSTEGTVAEGGESTVATIEGMAASIDEKTKAESKEVEEEMAQKGEVKETGEKGVAAASIDAGSSTASPSESTTAIPTTTVPSPADLAKSQHHEKGGAEFGQTGQKGTEEVHEDAAHKGEVKGTGAGKASTSSSLDTSSTVAPSDTDGSPFAVASDAATGELTTSSSIDGGAGGLARQGEAESTTSSSADTTAESTTGAVESTSSSSDSTVESTTGASETTSPSSDSTVESTTGASEGSSTAASSDGTEESSTSSSEGSSTVAASESQDTTSSIDSEGLIQKALATAHLKPTEKGEAPTTAVPSPADLAKSQHHEKGGAEFGQTGQRGSEGVGEQEDEIKSSTIAPVEASSSSTGESLDGGIDRALTAIGEITTEPPVQAVKDLLDALASGDFDKALLGKKPNGTGTEAEKLLSGKTQITEMATPINKKHECSSGKLSFSTFELVDLTTKFEADAVAFSLPHCARLCYETGCTMAAYSRFPRPLCLMHFEKDEKESHRCNSETNRTSHWEYSSLQQVVAIDCILCEGQTFFEHDHTVDITTLHAIDDSIVTVPSPQGISKACDGGRIEFQFVPAGSLPRLNVTNDVPARTPADCARKCHETKGCTTAGFIPTPSAEIANGVCLLTSDDEVCISREDAVPQHASVTAFVISCIRCTSCSYTLSHMTLSSSTAKFQHIATVQTIGECAQVCHDKKCVFAQYDATTNTCALSMEASLDNGCRKVEPPLAVKGAYPVRLECVQCKE